jgi:DNA-binding transcriptional MerR regulator
MSSEENLYGVEELAERAGVSRRTVRYYVQRGLLPAPLGLGRGKHYTQAHLEALVRIRELQEAAVPLEEIATRLQGRTPEPVPAPGVSQTTWTRIVLSADVELHVRGRRLSEEQVRKLSAVVKRTIGEISS